MIYIHLIITHGKILCVDKIVYKNISCLIVFSSPSFQRDNTIIIQLIYNHFPSLHKFHEFH